MPMESLPRARSPRSALVLLGALAALISPPSAGAADPEGGPGPLPWRVGGDVGFTVDAAAFPDSAGERLDVYLRLPPATLSALEREGEDARLKVSVRLRSRYGAKHHESSLEFDISSADTANGFGKVVVLPFPVKSGGYRMQVKLEDVRSRKRGLAYVGRRVPRSTTIEGDVMVPEGQRGTRVSTAEFLWGSTGRFGRAVTDSAPLPNPERLYGLFANQMRVGFRAHQSATPRPWRWKASVVDAKERVVAVRETTAAAAAWLDQEVTIDMTTEPAGVYHLEIGAAPEGEPLVVRRAPFNVAWQRSSWERNPRDIEDVVHFLLEAAEEEEGFARMGPGEQEQFLDVFWRERDPTPFTAENEARKEFLARIDHANRTWGRSGVGKGMFSDMGRIYIRHGEPDEILRQVIPAGDQTLTQLIQQLEITEDRPTGSVSSKGLGGDVRPFEVWVYDATRPQPITDKPTPASDRRSLKRKLFLFVDEHGYGDYRLRYNTE
jgi:GWxTD domain-containing protein